MQRDEGKNSNSDSLVKNIQIKVKPGKQVQIKLVIVCKIHEIQDKLKAKLNTIESKNLALKLRTIIFLYFDSDLLQSSSLTPASFSSLGWK